MWYTQWGRVTQAGSRRRQAGGAEGQGKCASGKAGAVPETEAAAALSAEEREPGPGSGGAHREPPQQGPGLHEAVPEYPAGSDRDRQGSGTPRGKYGSAL